MESLRPTVHIPCSTEAITAQPMQPGRMGWALAGAWLLLAVPLVWFLWPGLATSYPASGRADWVKSDHLCDERTWFRYEHKPQFENHRDVASLRNESVTAYFEGAEARRLVERFVKECAK